MSSDESLLKVLASKSTGSVAIFAKGDYYCCYEDDAFLIANEIFLSEVGLRRFSIGNHEITYHNLNSAQYARVVRDVLLLLHYRVEVYELSENYWTLKAKGSLGCLGDFEEIVGNSLELSELSTVMAVSVSEEIGSSEYRVAAAFCNVQDLRMTVAEFSDSEHFSNLEKCLVSLIPRECIILPTSSKKLLSLSSGTGTKLNQLDTAFKRANVNKIVGENIMQDFEPEQLEKEVRQFIQSKYKDVHLSAKQVECLFTLIDTLQVRSDSNYNGQFTLINYKSAGYMYMDMAAVKALELFTVSYDEDGGIGETSTLYNRINKCRTQVGQRLLRSWMRRPLMDLRQISERLDVVEALKLNPSTLNVLYDDILRRVPDISSLVRKLVQKRAGLQECYRLYQLICLLKRLESVLSELHENAKDLAPSVNELLYEPVRLSNLQFEKYKALIESAVDVQYVEGAGSYRIRPDIDEQLNETAERMKSIEKKCEKALDKMSSKLSEAVKLDSNSSLGFYFRCTMKAEKYIRQNGLRIVEATKGTGVKFTSRLLDELNEEYKDLQRFYEKAQSELVKSVVETCSGYIPAFNQLSDNLARIDVLVSFSVLATNSSFVYERPILLDKDKHCILLKDCRHPVLESLEGCNFIPNDVVLGENDGDRTRFLILTGANMGGKSTYLRSCALTILLGQMGSFVPCSSAKFSIIDGIHTRIGSCDYQCKGVSTFMAEMIDSASILEGATKNSLVIIDELGRGTSTYDGFGLAWAIAEDILNRIQCFCIFATHFHEMFTLQELYPDLVRPICVATHLDENNQLTLLYRVVPGFAERSFGLNIASMVGIPESVIQTAEEMLKKLEKREVSETDGDKEFVKKLKSLHGEELRNAILNSVLQ
uniref:DNA_MISMATCH_REPAIR_2 domain-containing protein n=1 Tax=Syphacia muris TaxID=451379 RepID=A0A0N5AJT6_9BILA